MITKRGLPLTLFVFAFILTISNLVCLWFGLSPLYALGFTALAGALVSLFRAPLGLLFTLIIVRMSLDFFGETTTLALTQSLSVTLSQLIGLGVAALGLALFTTNRQAQQSLRISLPLLLVMVWGIFTLLFSISPSVTARELLRILDIIALAALAYASIQTIRDYKYLLITILLSSVVPVALGFSQFIRGVGFQDEAVGTPRIFGTFSHPNVFSLYLFTLVAVVAIAMVMFRRSVIPVLTILLFGTALTTMLVLTYTRVAWLTLFLFLLIIAIARFRMLLVPLIVVPSLLYFIFLPFQERVDSMFHADPGTSIAWRQNLWSTTIHKTIEEGHGILGFGMGTFYTVSGQLHDPGIGQNEAHNDFVKFFVEGGIVGLIIYLAFLFTLAFPIFRRAFLSSADAQPTGKPIYLILFALVASLAFASLSDNVFKNTPVQWILWTLLAATIKIFPKKLSK